MKRKRGGRGKDKDLPKLETNKQTKNSPSRNGGRIITQHFDRWSQIGVVVVTVYRTYVFFSRDTCESNSFTFPNKRCKTL